MNSYEDEKVEQPEEAGHNGLEQDEQDEQDAPEGGSGYHGDTAGGRGDSAAESCSSGGPGEDNSGKPSAGRFQKQEGSMISLMRLC